jgi:glutaminase
MDGGRGGLSEIRDFVRATYERHRGDTTGAVADYIPELAKADPEAFGIAIATVSGEVVAVGDCEREFTIQSVVKALTYCVACELLGADAVALAAGVEPSGEAFNCIEMDPRTGRPYNPMVNAGAISLTTALYARFGEEALPLILDRLGAAAGRPLAIDEAVYRSEKETGHRNLAIAWLLRNLGVTTAHTEEGLDLYFRQCSILVTACDLAMIGATLANIGTQPVTGAHVFALDAVRDTLSVMLACGMYDYSGSWIHRVGIPAKSGVGGGVLGAVNRQLGIGTFSPRLDARGNSVRGLEAFADLSAEFGLHAFDAGNAASSFLSVLLRRR